MEEHDLILRLKAGDRQALEALIDRYTHYCGAVAARALGPCPSREDLEEVAADAFLALWRGREGLDPDRPLRPWLAVTARNLALDRLRARRETQELSPRLPDSRPGPEELAIHREQLRATVADIQTRLSPFERKVLAAHLAGGSYRQIAWQLGCTPKAVENALARLRRKLRGGYPTH